MSDKQNIEQLVKEVLSSVLSISKESISLTDSFRELGGNSLQSMVVYSMIREKGLNISPKKYANQLTIGALIDTISLDL